MCAALRCVFSEAWKTSLWEGPVALTCPVPFSQSLPSHANAVILQNQPHSGSGKCLLYSLQLVGDAVRPGKLLPWALLATALASI